MVAHQHIGMHLNVPLLGVVLQQSQHSLKVSAVHENGLAVIATQDHVVRVTSQGKTGKTCHAPILIGI
jgi:hypothetical protein